MLWADLSQGTPLASRFTQEENKVEPEENRKKIESGRTHPKYRATSLPSVGSVVTP